MDPIAAIVFVVAANLSGGALKFSSKNGLIFLASRILHDMPELMEDMCQDDPELTYGSLKFRDFRHGTG
jgi:hypothetical protein